MTSPRTCASTCVRGRGRTVGAACDSARMRFTLVALPDRFWPAVTFGDTWNGWATSVVTREVLADLLVTSGEPHRWDGEIAMVGTPAGDMRPGVEPEFFDPVRPRDDGLFDLAQMGWVFVRVDERKSGPELFYPDDAPMRGPSFDYERVADVVGQRAGFGPIWVVWDTKVLSLFETYGAGCGPWSSQVGTTPRTMKRRRTKSRRCSLSTTRSRWTPWSTS